MRLLPIVALCAVCAAQPRFEAASVKRMERGVIQNSLGPGTVILKGNPLKILLTEAFGVKAYQIAGPAWLDEDCFEIVAKMPEGSTQDQIPAMLQALLAERFKLAAHKENRPRPVYALVVDKGGPKLKEASANFRSMGPKPGQLLIRAAADNQGYKGIMTMASLAHSLSLHLDRPVQDFTGLEGKYEIDLSWRPDSTIDRLPEWTRPGTGAPSPDAPEVNLFTALRESLGLKLEPRTAPAEMLVIDHVDRVPIEN